ncbi:hypothetical protein QYF61_002285 [Mycteria americana]|uniref:Uncharacterized protein n=1 Tax=Mycteria americana TaxID=33587 RepID=A0AAN7N4X8_MYCAM|nr:hypothetical protein QYF61_002285 [Mycteria americana]
MVFGSVSYSKRALKNAAFQPLFPKPVALHGVVVTQVQDPALSLVEPHTIGLGPSIQPVQVPLQSPSSLKQINDLAQLGVSCKLTEGALNPLIQIIDKDKCPAFLDSFALQDCLPRDSVNQSPKQAKGCPPEIPGGSSADPPPYFSTYQKLCHSVIAMPKTASNRHITHKSFSVDKQQVQRGTFPSWLTHQLCQEVSPILTVNCERVQAQALIYWKRRTENNKGNFITRIQKGDKKDIRRGMGEEGENEGEGERWRHQTTMDKPKYLSVIVQNNIDAWIEKQIAKKSFIYPGSTVTHLKQLILWVITALPHEKQSKQYGFLRGSLEEEEIFTPKVTSQKSMEQKLWLSASLRPTRQPQKLSLHGGTVQTGNKLLHRGSKIYCVDASNH